LQCVGCNLEVQSMTMAAKNTSSIYLDYNATTPVHSDVLDAMWPWFSEDFGNASSRSHAWGWRAEQAVKKAREEVRSFIGATDGDLVFTSGATEALNLGIKGLASSWRDKKKHLLCWATEHKAVLDVCKALRRDGFDTTVLPVLPSGLPDLHAYEAALRSDTLLVCGMLANNETGVIFPIQQLAEMAHARGSFFLCDATQAVGKIPVDVKALDVDMLCLSAHKFYGPKGVGALWLAKKPGLKLQPLLHGGGHEQGLRSGTLAVPLLVGLGKAAVNAAADLQQQTGQLTQLRNDLEAALAAAIPEIRFLGAEANRLPNTSNVFFADCPAASLIKALRKLAVATGSACSSAAASPSHVLLAMGLSETEAGCCLRFSLGKPTTFQEVHAAVQLVVEAVTLVRASSPAWQFRDKTNAF
jgi:cysteine desulfurase